MDGTSRPSTPPSLGRARRFCRGKLTRLASLLISIVLVTACSSPAQRYNAAADARSYVVRSVPAAPFRVTAYLAPAERPSARPWHVYLTGDGTPWERGRHPSQDPTPRRPMALELMDRDPGPRLLLHRPCYGRHPPDPACHPGLWTGGRYGESVVDAMDRALDRLVAELEIDGVVLVGYSGGGLLARLLAGRREDVRALVTIAANLDHSAWTRRHGYLPLEGSLRLVDELPLDARVLQWHLVGARDPVVPPGMVRQAARHDPHARVEVVDGVDHRCCWVEAWPRLLERLDEELAATSHRGEHRAHRWPR
ncbi:alpha/beta fold hydrolase [Halomonas sp. M4R5S39]|uniref:alpha/beta fold hydrolase n=1 Tax=Halomonas kalidii TaxID=3043293 RepID=UPI0024A89EA0|nr:alpha/beta fold hydrolase [Halomonas kalidii]MDI5983657.1 alpha/beta fold hydrolase [Halomonas kalidii]